MSARADKPASTFRAVDENIAKAASANKCHRCGCFQDAVASLEVTHLVSNLNETLQWARSTLKERQYDCLGCTVCWAAEALNQAAELVDLRGGLACPADEDERRFGWPPYAGEYRVLRFAAPVAVCTLHTTTMVEELVAAAPGNLSVVGPLQTENLGIERIIENVVANPHIRLLLLCGEDTGGSVGHFPGQSLIALVENGIDDRGRIVGAEGRDPVLRNVGPKLVEHFRRQVHVLDHRGETNSGRLARLVDEVGSRTPEPMKSVPPLRRNVRIVPAQPPGRLVLDPAGYVVVHVDRLRQMLVAEHYENGGVWRTLIEGAEAVSVMASLLREGIVTRTDHAAYLGRELALAEMALTSGGAYVQHRAPVQAPSRRRCEPPRPCGASSDCRVSE